MAAQREYYTATHEKQVARAAAYYIKHRDQRYNQWLKREYGITLEDYNRMLALQNGCCALCGEPPDKNRLCVDHDHETGLVRMLLCDQCNKGLGHFKESIPTLLRAVEYLQRFKEYTHAA